MGTSPLPRAVTMMTAALLLLCPLVGMAGLMDAALNPVPVLTLSINPIQCQAIVNDTQDGPVVFWGNATVEKLPVLTITVTLSASCPWPALIAPSTMTFKDSRSQQFVVNVVVPSKTSSLDVGQLLISGTAKAPGIASQAASASAVVTVRQYCGLEASVQGGPFEGIHAGSTVAGRLVVNNTGNGLDSVTIDLLDPNGLISTRDMARSVDVKQGESKAVPFTLHVNGSLGPMGNVDLDIAFVCTSTEARNQGLNYVKTAWCTLSFGTASSSPEVGVPPGGEGDDDGTKPSEGFGGVPVAVMVLVVLIVVLSAIYYLGRERGNREDRTDSDEGGEPGP